MKFLFDYDIMVATIAEYAVSYQIGGDTNEAYPDVKRGHFEGQRR